MAKIPQMKLEAEDLEVGDIIWWKDSWVEILNISINLNGKYQLAIKEEIIESSPNKKFLLM